MTPDICRFAWDRDDRQDPIVTPRNLWHSFHECSLPPGHSGAHQCRCEAVAPDDAVDVGHTILRLPQLPETERLQIGYANFVNEMRYRGIHVGVGERTYCVTCGQAWPCEESWNQGKVTY